MATNKAEQLYNEANRLRESLSNSGLDAQPRDILSAFKDQERYRKLKAQLECVPLCTGLIQRKGEFFFIEGRFDAAVDALHDPNGKKPSRRSR